MKVYITTPIYQGCDGMVLGAIRPELNKSYEDALKAAKANEEEDIDFTIYSSVENKIYSFDAYEQEWSVEDADISDEVLQEADEYSSLYIFETEYPNL